MTWIIYFALAGTIFNIGEPSIERNFAPQPVSATIISDVSERFDQSYPFSPTGKIEINNINGSVIVETWDKPEIKLEVIKTADTKERLADLTIEIEADQNSFRLSAEFAKRTNRMEKHAKLEADFHLKVPKTAVLDEIQTVNGSVTISNSVNFTKASTVNGTVKAVNIQGNTDLSTVNGTVEAVFDKLQPGNVISLSTVNGTASLTIPSDANATVRADSLNGEIRNDFGLPVRKGEFIGRDLYGRLGSGDVKIKLESVNGNLTIKRNPDGLTPHPVTDLLPKTTSQKDVEGDFNNDFEAAMRDSRREMADARRDIEAARRELERSLRESNVDNKELSKAQKAAAEGLKIAMDALQPEIAKITEAALKEASAAIELAVITQGETRSDAVKAVPADRRFAWRSPFMEEKNGGFQVKESPTVTIEAKNCSVSLRGWDKSEVRYSMSKSASNVAQKSVEVTALQKDSNNIEIKVSNPNGGFDGYPERDAIRVHLEVFVPKKSNLKILANGAIRLENISGEIDLEGADESINVRDSDGKLKLKIADGTARVIGFRGSLDASASDGQMYLEGDFDRINANTGDGTITITIPEDTNANVFANKSPINVEGISITGQEISRNGEKHWKLGKGGKEFRFNVGDGSVSIRNMRRIAAGL